MQPFTLAGNTGNRPPAEWALPKNDNPILGLLSPKDDKDPQCL